MSWMPSFGIEHDLGFCWDVRGKSFQGGFVGLVRVTRSTPNRHILRICPDFLTTCAPEAKYGEEMNLQTKTYEEKLKLLEYLFA